MCVSAATYPTPRVFRRATAAGQTSVLSGGHRYRPTYRLGRVVHLKHYRLGSSPPPRRPLANAVSACVDPPHRGRTDPLIY
ncbi:hypothetical protein EVAR_67233_1 [Eumeta japonica]|uniref:Uncharacterized protein n=1 Tax=Eumeta variegata TaxID=151549 RepID=A0A4C1YUY4_EUMVA|nr:hypothetical protein EVAR_67233_1 [Eumeta japonica]